MASSYVRVVVLLLSVSMTLAADPSYFFFVNQTDSLFDTVSLACNTALTAPILQCPKEILNLLGTDDYLTLGNDTVMDVLCNGDCPGAFSSYRATVVSACANDPQPMDGFPSTYWVDAAASAFTQMCLTDSATGIYCTDFFNETFGDATDPTDVLGGYSTTDLCSECVVNLFKHQQSTPYSNYDPQMAEAWAAIQANCDLSYPTATPTLLTNVTSLGNYAPSGYATASCLSERTYTVVSGDNCNAIAETSEVSTGSLIALNSLRLDCTDIFVDQVLCLPLACTSYVVQSGDTCISIANASATSFQQLVAWNPTINNYCTNLIAGQNICIGPPGGYANFTTIAGATVTQTAIYATTTTSRPSPVASGTTLNCGKYYLVEPGDYCQLVAVNATISLDLFEAINPSIDDACDNLLSGFYYCILPTENWNVTASSTTVSAPTTTPSGTTADCYEYYVIQSGDYCALLEDDFDITFAQLQGWNPSLLDDCSNLLLGEAYCVNGGTSSNAVVTAAGDVVARGGATTLFQRKSAVPTQTPSPTTRRGGVAIGWPGLGSPKLMKQIGL
ncbi:hypothetical protein BX600DRAFT_554788 [Xylariales sp. PMI_506]|nr:hypothetical protein BX600DRAFT_554788 [Xylariales sp. PMI_506]